MRTLISYGESENPFKKVDFALRGYFYFGLPSFPMEGIE